MQGDIKPFSNLNGLVTTLKIGLGLTIAITLGGLVALLGMPESYMSEESLTNGVDLWMLLFYFIGGITSILFFVWIYLVSRNTEHLNRSELGYRPGWAVGWFFIPIANLWKPYDVMKSLFFENEPKESDTFRPGVTEVEEKPFAFSGRHLQEEESRYKGLVGLWWALYIGAQIGFQGVQFAEKEVTISILMIIGILFLIGTLICAMLIIQKLTALQNDRYDAQQESWRLQAEYGAGMPDLATDEA